MLRTNAVLKEKERKICSKVLLFSSAAKVFSKSIKMKVLLLLSLVGLITVASSDTTLPPKISKCCTDDSAPECKRIDAALGHEGHLYTFFGPFYAKLRVNSKGIPEALEGYPKKITGKEKDNWFADVKVDWNSPLDAAFTDNCVRLLKVAKSYCFEIKATIDGETIELKSETELPPQSKDTIAVMGTKFKGQSASWVWFWLKIGNKCYQRIREGTTAHGSDVEIPPELIPQAVAGLLVGDTFKGFVFLRNSGLIYTFDLKAKETKIKPSTLKLKATLFMGCSRVPNETTTADGRASSTTPSVASTAVKGTTPEKKGIPLAILIAFGVITGLVILVLIALAIFWLIFKRGKDSDGEEATERGSGSGLKGTGSQGRSGEVKEGVVSYTGRRGSEDGRSGRQVRRDIEPQRRGRNDEVLRY